MLWWSPPIHTTCCTFSSLRSYMQTRFPTAYPLCFHGLPTGFPQRFAQPFPQPFPGLVHNFSDVRPTSFSAARRQFFRSFPTAGSDLEYAPPRAVRKTCGKRAPRMVRRFPQGGGRWLVVGGRWLWSLLTTDERPLTTRPPPDSHDGAVAGRLPSAVRRPPTTDHRLDLPRENHDTSPP